VVDELGLTEGASPTSDTYRKDEKVLSVEGGWIEEATKNAERVWDSKRKLDGAPGKTVESV
jgi:hypothetical protein